MDLTKPPQKILVVSVVGVVVFVWILVWLFGPKPEKIQPGAPIDTMLTSLLQSGKQGRKDEVKPVEEPVRETWGRDPFALPGWVEEQERRETQPSCAYPKSSEAWRRLLGLVASTQPTTDAIQHPADPNCIQNGVGGS